MLNFRFFSLVGSSAVFSLFAILGMNGSAQAATLSPGTLVKASQPAVYYFSENGKRYAFPDQSTYASWYTDFSGVQTVTDNELAQIPFGGIVTIRPGSRMVKITTDPRVYAVTRGGILRWVQTEALARSFYGENWNRLVNDVPDAFFTNYRTQSDITQTADFSPAIEQSTVSTIDADLRARGTTVTPPVTTPTSTAPVATSTPSTPTSTPVTPTTPTLAGRIDLLSSGPYISGDTVTLLATVTRGYAERIGLLFGSSMQLSPCASTPCRAEFSLPNVLATSTFPFQAVFSSGEGPTYVSATATQSVTILPNPISDAIYINGPTQSLYGSGRLVRVEVGPTMSARNIKIFQDEALKQECDSTQACEFNEVETARSGASHTVYAVVIDGEYHRWFSRPITFPVVE